MARGDLELVTDFVILGRSKERSDAAQTLESMPLLRSVARVRNSAPLQPLPKVTAWILGSSLRFASLRPRMTKLIGLGQSPTGDPYPTIANASRVLPDAVLTGFWPIHCTCRPRVAAADSVLPCRSALRI